MKSDLHHLQRLLQSLIVAPEGVTKALREQHWMAPDYLESLVAGDERLSAVERVGIYADMYFYRILDCLKEEYPATLAVMGDQHFHNLVTAYLLVYPPTNPSILYAGQHLAAFLRTHRFIEQWPFIADLATLERALIDVFHRADTATLDASAMRAVAPEDWSALLLKTVPALEILDSRWRVVELLKLVEEGGASADHQLPSPAAANSPVLVWRKNCLVYYREIDRLEAECLAMLVERGAEFGALCDAIAARAGEHQDPAALTMKMLSRWLEDGLLEGPELRAINSGAGAR